MTQRQERPAAKRLASIVAAIVLLLVAPPIVWAHARLTRSDPAAGATLTAAPTSLRLWFSEAPELAASSLVLTDSTGTRVALGALEAGDGKLGVRARITAPLPNGRYTIDWRVAAADGHVLSGRLHFMVAAPVAAISAAPAQVPVASVDTTAGLPDPVPEFNTAVAATEAVGFAALLIVIGVVAFRLLVLPGAGVTPAESDVIARRASALGSGAAWILAFDALIRFAFEWRAFNSVAGMSVSASDIATGTQWGRGWMIQIAAAIAFAIALRPGRRGTGAPVPAVIAALVLSVTFGLGGHAVASPWPTTAVLIDGAHVLGASGWLGALVVMTFVAVPMVLQSGRGEAGVARLVDAFTPVALTCAGLVVTTGLLSAWMRLGSIGALTTSVYGRVLLLKVACVLAVVAVGAFNWRRMRPALHSGTGARTFARSTRFELGFGLLVILATAVLVSLPTPV